MLNSASSKPTFESANQREAAVLIFPETTKMTMSKMTLTRSVMMVTPMKKEQVGAGANLGFAAASTLGRRKNPIKQLPWSKGKQQLVTIISLAMMIIYVAKMMVVVVIRRRRSRSKSRRIRRIRRGAGRGRLVITGPKNEWPAWLWVNQAISNCERSNCQTDFQH